MTYLAPYRTENRLSPNSVELRLLCLCLSQDDSSTRLSQIRDIVRHSPNWTYLIRVAVQHQVTPLLYESLLAANCTGIPPEIESYLQRRCQINGLKNLFLTSQLNNIQTHFQSANLPMVAYKGPLLAKLAYGSLALREFGDLDLLVPPQDFQASQNLLCATGFEHSADLMWEAHYASPDGQVNVDLHRAIAPDFFNISLDFIDFTEPVLSTEALLLLLCIQVIKDCCHWRLRLGQLIDIAELLRSNPMLDFTGVEDQANQIGCSRILWTSLSLINQWGADLPRAISARLPEMQVESRLANGILGRLTAELDQPTIEPTDRGFWYYLQTCDHRLYWQVRERLQDKLFYIGYWFKDIVRVSFRPTDADRTWVRLPGALEFLYYWVHPIRLLYKHVLIPSLLPWRSPSQDPPS